MSKRTGKMRKIVSENHGNKKPTVEHMKALRAKAIKLLEGSEMWILVGETPDEWICSMNGDGHSIQAMIDAIFRTYQTTLPVPMAPRTREEH